MSLNVENLFIKCADQAQVIEAIERYWASPSGESQPNWSLPSSYEPLLARNPKRKIAISPPRNGWVAVVESKGVVDFALAKALSEKLNTTVLVIQLSEATGVAGFASAVHGEVLESRFDQEHDDPLGYIRQALQKYKVPFDAMLFREIFQKSSEGWLVKQKK